MKKLSFLIIINLVLFSSCVCIGSRELIIEPVNVTLENFNLDENIIVRFNYNKSNYSKKLPDNFYKILQKYLVNNEIDNILLNCAQRIDFEHKQLKWSFFLTSEPITLFNLRKGGLENKVILVLKFENQLFFIDSDYIESNIIFKLNDDKTFLQSDIKQYEKSFSILYNKTDEYNFTIIKK